MNRIVLFATHIVSDIEAIAKEIIILNSGNVVEIDTPENLISKVSPHVWRVEAAEHELQDLQARYLISNIRKSADGLAVKAIGAAPPQGAVAEPAVNLEDVYLYYVQAGDSLQ